MNTSLHYLFMADHMLIQKRLFSAIKDLQLSIGQPKVLDYLKDNDGAVQKDIAKGCYIEPATLSAVLCGMEKNGLIIRRSTLNNRRNLNVFMTDKGKEMSRRINDEFLKIEQKSLAGFTDAEAENLEKYLIQICKNLEE